ncbi:MAG: hypothetical protein ACOYL8_02940 [Patescibacteria group bacterium]
MKVVFCPVCRRVKFDPSRALDEITGVDPEVDSEINEEFEEVRSEQLRKYANDLTFGERTIVWLPLSDEEWGALQIIINSNTLLTLVGNYVDYPEECPDCQKAYQN